ncbi:hypothetical protein [Kineococcus sp. SYSU DK006]|uniref:hypothetical protein n=1 Tax=Kineococcus sp. SYSU DK006 TaxID=3383127 RepID=UPI003D7E7EAA
MSARFTTRRAAGVAATSYATLALVPWAVDWATAGTRSPRAGLLIAAAPLALLFGALAGYAAAPLGTARRRPGPRPTGATGVVATTPPPAPPATSTAAAATTAATPHTRAGPRLVLLTPAPAPPRPAADRPARPLHPTPSPVTGPVADPALPPAPRTSTRRTP